MAVFSSSHVNIIGKLIRDNENVKKSVIEKLNGILEDVEDTISHEISKLADENPVVGEELFDCALYKDIASTRNDFEGLDWSYEYADLNDDKDKTSYWIKRLLLEDFIPEISELIMESVSC